MHLDWNVVAICAACVAVTVIDWLAGVFAGSKLHGFQWNYLDNHLRTTVIKLGGVVFLAFLQQTGQAIDGNFLFMQLSVWLGVGAGITFSAYGLAFMATTLSDIGTKISAITGTTAAPPMANGTIAPLG